MCESILSTIINSFVATAGEHSFRSNHEATLHKYFLYVTAGLLGNPSQFLTIKLRHISMMLYLKHSANN